jgi:hypothetical protein
VVAATAGPHGGAAGCGSVVAAAWSGSMFPATSQATVDVPTIVVLTCNIVCMSVGRDIRLLLLGGSDMGVMTTANAGDTWAPPARTRDAFSRAHRGEHGCFDGCINDDSYTTHFTVREPAPHYLKEIPVIQPWLCEVTWLLCLWDC